MRTFLAVAALAVAQLPAAAQTVSLPTLRIDAPASLEAVAERVGRFRVSRLTTAMTLAGLTNAGPPIDVLIIPEGSDLASRTPRWISGFADARRNAPGAVPPAAPGPTPRDSLENRICSTTRWRISCSRESRAGSVLVPPVVQHDNARVWRQSETGGSSEDRSRLAWSEPSGMIRRRLARRTSSASSVRPDEAANQRASRRRSRATGRDSAEDTRLEARPGRVAGASVGEGRPSRRGVRDRHGRTARACHGKSNGSG